MDFLDDNKYKIIRDSIIVVLLLFLVILNIFMFINKRENVVNNSAKKIALVSKEEIKDNDDDKCINSKSIRVDVKGAVVNQGVYYFKEGDIVNDALEAAGGVNNKGVTKNINLSKKLEDQMVIYVYTSTELNNFKKEKNIDTKENVTKEICKCPEYEISSCEGASIIVNEDNITVGSEESNDKVNINTASKEILLTLTGIGESKAMAIIDYRNNNGLFKSIDDIKQVSGIGEALFAKIKDYITI